MMTIVQEGCGVEFRPWNYKNENKNILIDLVVND